MKFFSIYRLIICYVVLVMLCFVQPLLAQVDLASIDLQSASYRQAAKDILLVQPQGPEIEEQKSPVLIAFSNLGAIKRPFVMYALANHIDAKVTFALRNSPRQPIGEMYPAVGALLSMGRPARAFVIEAAASKQRSQDYQNMAIFVIQALTDFRSNEPTRYFLLHASANYDERAKNLRRWAERLPYGEMPTKAMLEAAPIAAPIASLEVTPEPDFANEAQREAAITRLARIFELKDGLTSPNVQWTQDADRQKVFDALDELIQLNAIGEGEAGPEMAQLLGFLFAPEPPKPPFPQEFNAAFPPEPPIVPPYPIKPLVFPNVPQGSSKTETYFPAVPKLIQMGPRIAPFIVEEMALHYNGQAVQNGVYTLRRILGSDDAVKRLLREHAALNEKKAARLRELRDSIPAN